MVLETAVNRRADLLVTVNERDYRTVPGRFGITVGPRTDNDGSMVP